MAAAFALGKHFAFVGMLLGGVVSYLAYEFKAVISAFGRAWRSLSGWRWKMGWRDVRLYLASWFFASVVLCSAMLSLWVVLAIITGTRNLVDLGVVLVFGCLFSLYAATENLQENGEDIPKMNHPEAYRSWREVAFYVNPITFAVYLFIIAWWCLRRIPRAPIVLYRSVIFLGRVTWRVFRYVHSDIRALCFVDGTLGAAAGYIYGHPAAGLLAGIAFGLVNYIVVRRLVFRTTEVRV